MTRLNRIVIHKIDKRVNDSNVDVRLMEHLLPIEEEVVIDFANALSRAYFDKKSRFYTQFRSDFTPPFQSAVNSYLEDVGDESFLDFSQTATNILKNAMQQKIQSKGGYLTLMHFDSNVASYLLVALLDNKQDFSIREDTLDIIRQITLNIEHMAMASVINLDKYRGDNATDYLTFLRGLREVPDYFIDFIGGDVNRRRDIRELSKKWVHAIESFFQEKEYDPDQIDQVATVLIDRVKELNRSQEPIRVEMMANIIYPEAPEEFIEFIYDEESDFALPNEFDRLDTGVMKSLTSVNYSNRHKGFLIKFRKRDFGDVYRIDGSRLIIDDQEIVDGIRDVIEND